MIRIRSAAAEDAPGLCEIYAPYVKNTAISFEYSAPDAEEFRRRIENTLMRFPYLVAEEDGVPMGYAYAGPLKERAAYARSCELSVYVDGSARGRGIGRLLYEALEEELARRGFLNLYACIASSLDEEDPYLSRDSEHFHEHMGFVKIAEFHQCGYKFGRWYTMIWMEKLIGPHCNAEEGLQL